MNGNIDTLVQNAKIELKGAKNENMLKTIEHKYVGNNGLLTRSLKSAAQLPGNMRSARERAINTAIRKIEMAIDRKQKELKLTK